MNFANVYWLRSDGAFRFFLSGIEADGLENYISKRSNLE